MRSGIVIFILLLSLYSQSQTNSIKKKPPLRFGIEYKISSGTYQGHHLGISLSKNKHSFSLGAIFCPPYNDYPFEERWNPGSYLNYEFYPSGMEKRTNLFLHTSFSHLHFKQQSVWNFSVNNFTGLGINCKIIKNLNFKGDVGLYTFYYSNSKYGTGFNYNRLNHFGWNDLLLRFSVVYTLKNY